MPPAQKPISREYRIYLALWRKALLSEELVKFQASSYSMAIAMRQGMYRAIRPFRNGQANDEQLRMAAEKFVVYLPKTMVGERHEKDYPHWLILNPRATLAELDGAFDLLGIDEEDLLLGDERAIQQSLSKFLEPEGKPVEPARATPYFTRD